MLDKNMQHATLDMMPIIEDRITNAINASEKAFQTLNKNLHPRPQDVLDDEQCLKDHEIQIEQLLLLKGQCEFWRKKSYLTPAQKIALLHLESLLTECEKISQHVVFILQKKLQ